ncbi:MAG: lamin tail domain-containing protein [Pirellulaceae bacterium]
MPGWSNWFPNRSGTACEAIASRNAEHKKHSLSLRFREDYGDSELDFPLFENSPVTQFESIHLRARYNNSWIHWDQGQRNRGSMIREAWMRDTMLAAGDISAGHGDYVHLYLNGIYWGVYEMHERQDASHYAAYFGGDAWEYSAVNANAVVDGDGDSWNNLRTTVNSGDWEAIQQVLDVDNHILFNILQLYGGNQDLKTDGNWRAAGGGVANAPWRFYMWDVERILENVRQTGTSPVSDLMGFLARLDDHDDYRIRFADHVHRLLFNGGALTPEATAQRWMDRANQLDVAIVAESARWGDLKQSRPLTRDAEWVTERDRLLETYFPDRTAHVLQQFRSRRLYPSTDAAEFLVNGQRQHGGLLDGTLTLENPNAAAATIYYTTDGSDPRLAGGELNPAALIYSGQIALQRSALVSVRIKDDASGEWSALTQADFLLEEPADASNLRITEIDYNPQDGRPELGEMALNGSEFEFIEIRNVSDSPINLDGVRFEQVSVGGDAQGVVFSFSNQTLAPGSSTVVVRNRAAFESRYGTDLPMASGNNGVGGQAAEFGGGRLGDGGEQITLVAADGQLIEQVTYADDGIWPERADGAGSSLERLSSLADGNLGTSWVASERIGGSPGIGYAPAAPSVVISEVLANSNAPAVDQVELYNVTNQAIDISGWFVSDSANHLEKHTLPAGSLVPANGYLVLSETELGFGLKGAR